MTPRLEVSGLAVRYGEVAALDDVSLSVAPGEVIAVLGPSGSGKSTFLRAVAGLQPLDAGTVVVDGVDMAGVAPHERGLGMMFQHHALFPHLDVAANVGFGLRMQGGRGVDTRARVAELLGLVGLPHTERRDVATLSGGEQQRVALARALAPEPRLLLLDEPLGSLDRPLRERLVVDLRQLFGRLGVTVVAVTHDHGEAFALADRLAILDRGRVLQSGSPPEVWGAPTSARVAELLGFTNVIVAAHEDGRLECGWGDLGPATGPPGAAVLVRPEAVHLDPHGGVSGTVVASTFAGARARLRLDVPGAPALEADVPGREAPPVGATVHLRIDPAGVSVLAR